MIEDDLAASPVLLRQEIRRLRTLLPADLSENESVELRDLALAAMSRPLCPFNDMGCACPGTCVIRAEEVLKSLEDHGLAVVRAKATPQHQI